MPSRIARSIGQGDRKFDKSRFFTPTDSSEASLADFDSEAMVQAFRGTCPSISETGLRGIIGFALYYYYLR